MPNFRLVFGRNIPNTRFSVSRSEIKKFLSNYSELANYSLIHGDGKYEHEEEEFSQLDIYDYPLELAQKIRRDYCREFNQKSVLLLELLDNFRML